MSDHGAFAAILGRWQPVHLGHAAALQSLCERYEHVLIGIGSANIEDYRSPFSLAHVERMLGLVLAGFDNYELVAIPDLPDDDAWCEAVARAFGRPEVFYTANPYVRHLLAPVYPLAHPASVIPDERKTPVSGTDVRRALARGAGWEPLLPAPVAAYLHANGLDQAFRAAYGLHTLAMETVIVG